MNTHLLQLKVGPAKYVNTPTGLYAFDSPPEYWQVLPDYLIARCPICGSNYTAQLDTYSLKHWIGAVSSGNAVFDQHHQNTGCRHFVLVHYFLNLNGVTPADIPYLENNSEVPYVVPRLFEDTPGAKLPGYQSKSVSPCAVMHALPICRLEGKQFTRDYSLYTITYYALDPEPLKLFYSRSLHLEERFPQPPPNEQDSEQWWNLEYWVQQKKLWWLDAHDPKLLLRHYPSPFPYGNIEGIKHGMIYHDGRGKKSPDIAFIDGEAYVSPE